VTEKKDELAGLQAFVNGNVQGVGYRYFAMSAAKELGLTGWVRNLSDGNVQVVAEGKRDSLETFLARLRQGPRSGRVEDVRFSWLGYQGSFDRFDIRF